MYQKTAAGVLITLSVICVLLSAAPFTSAVFISLLLMCIAGVYGFLQHSIVATILLCFNSFAIIASPIVILGSSLFWLVLVAYIVGLGGTFLGIFLAKAES